MTLVYYIDVYPWTQPGQFQPMPIGPSAVQAKPVDATRYRIVVDVPDPSGAIAEAPVKVEKENT